ncbi:hypothetical protein QAD02_009555 [Eretmocerus hayati]|uniref:Uncharacterized protein n=1 Tax=Eretmocerus hayati TaxID=131215 RepID=A0ACC2N9P3_9HYME|nr:hypothetical protein QAD02_009555 [Eretmocerus hayati]
MASERDENVRLPRGSREQNYLPHADNPRPRLAIERLMEINKNYPRAKCAKAFTSVQLQSFLTGAPDNEYLDVKVAAVLSIMGACQRIQLFDMTLAHITVRETSLMITIPQIKKSIARTFSVNTPWKEIVQQYIQMRPEGTQHDFLFINYQNGRCTPQKMSIMKIGRMPRRMAEYLQLPNPETYTSHVFRKTSHALLANAGHNLATLLYIQ